MTKVKKEKKKKVNESIRFCFISWLSHVHINTRARCLSVFHFCCGYVGQLFADRYLLIYRKQWCVWDCTGLAKQHGRWGKDVMGHHWDTLKTRKALGAYTSVVESLLVSVSGGTHEETDPTSRFLQTHSVVQKNGTWSHLRILRLFHQVSSCLLQKVPTCLVAYSSNPLYLKLLKHLHSRN